MKQQVFIESQESQVNMEEKQSKNDPLNAKIKRLSWWKRLLAVLFRFLLLSGLILGVGIIAALIFASWFRLWAALLAVGLIVLSVILARLEYHFHQRLYDLENEPII